MITHILKKAIAASTLFCLMLFSMGVMGQVIGDYRTKVTGSIEWTTPSNWERCVTDGIWTGATESTDYPGEIQNLKAVYITGGTTVTISGAINYNIGSLIIEGGATSNIVQISGTNHLGVNGTITIDPPTGNVANGLYVDAGTSSCQSLSSGNTGNDNIDCKIRISTGTLTISTNIAMDTDKDRSDITFTDNGTLNVGGTLTLGTLSFETTTSVLNIGGEGTCFSPTVFTSGNGTVNFNRDGAQTTGGTRTFYNLTLSGSGEKTTTGATVNNILSMEGTATASVAPTYGADATLQYNTDTDRTAGVEWVTPFQRTGGVVIDNTGKITMNAAKVFNASIPLTINFGATLATNNLQLTLGGNFVTIGTFNAGSSNIVIAYTMAAQSIAGFSTTGIVSMTKTSGTATFQSNVEGGALTMNGNGGTLNLGLSLTHTFSGAWTRTNGTLNCSSSTLRIGGSISGTGGTFTAGTGTVEWYADGAQTIAGVTYNNLILSGSDVKTMPAAITVSNDLSILGSSILDCRQFNITGTSGGKMKMDPGTELIIGDPANTTANAFPSNYINENITLDPTSTVTYSADANQTVSGVPTYSNLTILAGNTGNRTRTLGAATVINGNLTISGNATYTASLLPAANNITVKGTTSINARGIFNDSNSTGTNQFDGALTIAENGQFINTNNPVYEFRGGITNNGTFTKSGTGTTTFSTNAQDILGSSILTFSGGDIVIADPASLVVANDISISGTNFNVNSNETDAFKQTSGTVTFALAGAQNIIGTGSGSLTFYNLTMGGTGVKTTQLPLNVTNDLTVSTGATFTLDNAVSASYNIGGNILLNGTGIFNLGTIDNQVVVAGSATIDGTLNFGTTNAKNVSIGGDLIDNTGTITMANDGLSHILTLSGPNNAISTFTTTGSNITVNYNLSGIQQVFASANYRNLILSGSGVKTAAGGITAIDLDNGGPSDNDVTLDMAGNTLSATSSIDNTNSTIKFSGVSNGQAISTGTVEYYGTGQTVATGTYNNLTLSNTSGTNTASNNLTVNGTLVTTSGGTLSMDTYTFPILTSVANNGTIRTLNLTATPLPSDRSWDGTIEYGALTGGQTVVRGTYTNLSLLNTSGINTAEGNITVSSTFTSTTSGILDMTTYSLLGNPATVNSDGIIETAATASALPSGKSWGGTIEYTATDGSQSVIAGTYNNLTLSNTTGTNTAVGNLTVNGKLVTTAGGTLDMGASFSLLGSLSTITHGGTIKTALLTATSATPIPESKDWGSSGTIEYSALSGDQTIVAGTYYNLTMLNSSGTNTAGGNITINGLFSSTGGGTLATANDISFSGSTVCGASINASAGNATYGSSSSNILQGVYNNLVLNIDASLCEDVTVNGTLNLSGGKITLGTRNLTLTGTNAVGSVNSSRYIVADNTGQLKKVFASGATSAYTLPIGDATNYSPVSLNFTDNSTQRTIGVRVTDAIHPEDEITPPSDYISRYWTFSDDQAGTYIYNATFTYVDAERFGLHTNLRVNRWDGGIWTQYTTTGASPNLTVSGVTETTSPLGGSQFTGRVNPTSSYTWNGGVTASWADPTSWAPNRLSLQDDDILIFDNAGTTTATNVPTQTIGQLILVNNSNVILQSAAAGQSLTISGGTGTDLDIPSGSTLQLSSTGTNQLGIAFSPAGQEATIAGTLIINVNDGFSNSYTATNSTTTVTGVITNNGGAITSAAGNLIFDATGVYNHARNGGAIPTASWNATSSINITGLTDAAPTGLGQTFGNLTWNSTGQSATLSMNSSPTVNGTFRIQSTNSNTLRLTGSAANQTLTVGNFTLEDGTLELSNQSGNYGILIVSGTFSQSGGTTITKSGNNEFNEIRFADANDVSPTLSGTINSTGTNPLIFNINKDSGKKVTLPVNQTFVSTVELKVTTGILDLGSSASTVTVNGPFNLLAAGTIDMSGHIDHVLNLFGLVNYTAGGTLVQGSDNQVVIYSGEAQNIMPLTYRNLILDGTSTKTLTGTTNVSNNLVVEASTTLAFGTTNRTLSITGNISGSGAINMGNAANHILNLAGNNTTSGVFNSGSGTFNYNGADQTVRVVSGVYSYYNLILSNGGTKTLSDDTPLNITGTFEITGSTLAFRSSAAQTVTVAGNLSGDGTINMGSGDHAHNLYLTGSTNSIGTLTSSSTSTVNYDRSGAQTIFPSPNYRNLTLSETGTKTMSASTYNINGDLTIASGATLDANTASLAVSGATSVAGTFTDGSNTGTNTFADLITISGSGSWTSTSVTTPSNLDIRNGITHGSSGTLSFGAATFSTNIQEISIGNSTGGISFANPVAANANLTIKNSGTGVGAGSLTFSGGLTLGNDIVITNQRAVIVTGALDGTNANSTWLNDINSTLTYGSTSTMFNTNGTLTATAAGNTVIYSSANAQTVAAFTYNNLTLSGVGEKTLMVGNHTVNGNLTITSTTLKYDESAAQTLTIGGNLAGNASSTLSMTGTGRAHTLYLGGASNTINTFTTTAASGSTVEYVSAGAQDVFASPNYQNLTISGGNTKTLSGNITVNSNLSISAGTLDLGSTPTTFSIIGNASITGTLAFGTTAKTVSISGNLSGVGAIDMIGSGVAHILNLGGETNAIGTFNTTAGSGSTVNYNRSGAQTVFGSNIYRNLTFSGGNTKTLQGNIIVNGTLTLTSGLVQLSDHNLTIASGSTISGGSVTAMIITNGAGELKRVFPSGSSAAFTFPVGDVTASNDYSPVALTFAANSTERTIGVKVIDDVHPNNGSPSDYITRYWLFTDDQAGTYSYTAQFTHSSVAPADLFGINTNLRVNRWDGANWTQYTSTWPSGTSIQAAGLTETIAPLNGSSFTGRVNLATYNWTISNSSGDWQEATNWNPARLSPQPNDILVFDGNGNTTASNVPSQTIGKLILANASNVRLQSAAAGQTLTISGGADADLEIPSGGTLQLSSTGANQLGITFSPAGQVATIAGTLVINANDGFSNSYSATNSTTTVTGAITNNGGAITSTAVNLIFGASGVYNQARNGGTIPTAGWNATSSVNITGVTDAAPSGLVQTFGNLSWNNSQSAAVSLNASPIINGNLVVQSTGGQTLRLTGSAANQILTVENFSLENGTLELSNQNVNSGVLIVSGTFSQSGGTTITKSGSNANNEIRFTGANDVSPVLSGTINSTGTNPLIFNANKDATKRLILSASQSFDATVELRVTTGILDLGSSASTVTVNGPFSLLAAGTIDMSGNTSNTLDLKGTVSYTAGGTLTAGSGSQTMIYSAAAQGVMPLSYRNLTLSGSGTKTLLGTITVGNDLNVLGTSTLYTNTYQITGNATGTFTMADGTTLLLGNTSNSTDVLFPTSFVNFSLGTGSTVIYQNNSTQTVSRAPAYRNLTIATSGTKTLATGAETVSVLENLSVSAGTFSLGANATSLSITGNTTVSGTLDFGTSVAKTVNLTGDLSGTGTIAMTGALAHALNLSGASNAISNFTTTASSGSTVNFNRMGSQSVFSSANYQNLTISGSDTKTLSGGITVNGNLNIASGTLDLGSAAITANISGTAIINGTLSFGITNPKTVNITGNLSGGGTINMTGASLAHNLNLSGASNAIGTFNTTPSSGSTVNYNGTNQSVFPNSNYRNLTFSGSGTKTADGNITLDATLNNSVTLNMLTHILGLGATTNNSGTIRFSGLANGLAIPSGTIEYFGVTQTVTSGTYNNLSLSNTSGAYTAGGNVTVSNSLTTASGSSFDLGTNTLLGTLNSISNSGLIRTSSTADNPIPTGKTWNGTVDYYGSAQTVSAGSYTNLNLSNAAGVYAAEGSIAVSGAFTSSLGGILNTSNNINFNGSTACGLSINASAATVTYGAGALNILQGTYYNLVIPNNAILCGDITVNGLLTLGTGLNYNGFSIIGLPDIVSVNVPLDKTYIIGNQLEFTINFNETVVVTATPTLGITFASGPVSASYIEGSGTSALLFRYSVVENNYDTDGIALASAITLSGGTIKDIPGNNTFLELKGVESTTGILVDGVRPVVSSVNVPADKTYKLGDDLNFTVNYNEDIVVDTGSGIPYINITLNTGGTVNAYYVENSSSSQLLFRYTIAEGNLDGDGIVVGGSITLNGGTIKDIPGNNVYLTLNSVGNTTNVWVDGVRPVVNTVAVPANNTYIIGNSLNFTVNFSEPVAVVVDIEPPYISITTNEGGPVKAYYVENSGPAALLFRYTIAEGDYLNDTDGIQLGGSIILNDNTTIKDAPGNDIYVALAGVPSTTGILVDGKRPSLAPVTIRSNNVNPTVAAEGDEVTVEFEANEAIKDIDVTIGGFPTSVYHITGFKYAAYNVVTLAFPPTIGFLLTCKDIAGNTQSRNTTTNGSTVTFDDEPPTISNIRIESGNVVDTLAKVGDVVYITFKGSEKLKNIKVMVYGTKLAASTFNDADSICTATYTMANADTPGYVNFTIEYYDLAGNRGVDGTATNDGSFVKFDKVPPTLSPVTIISNNSVKNNWAKVGDKIWVDFESSEELLNLPNPPTATIFGYEIFATQTGPVNLKHWRAEYTVDEDDTEGIVQFIIMYNDLAGNAGIPVTAKTEGANVTLDKTPPILFNISIVSDNPTPTRAKTGDLITLTYSSSEPVSLISGLDTLTWPTVEINGWNVSRDSIVNTSGNSWRAQYRIGNDVSGPVAFAINYTDRAGNPGAEETTTSNSSQVIVDNEEPTLSSVAISSNNIFEPNARAKVGDRITINFLANETLRDVAVNIIFTPELPDVPFSRTANVTNDGLNYSATYTLVNDDIEGEIEFTIDFIDLVGNPGVTVTETDGSSIRFDKTIPILTSVSIESNNTLNNQLAKVGNEITLSFIATEGIRSITAQIGGRTATLTGSNQNKDWQAKYTMQGIDSEGELSIYIAYQDSSGNQGIAATTTNDASSVTFDRTVPTLSSIAIESDNVDQAWAKVGNVISLTFISSEEILPTVTFNGNASTTLVPDENSWTATYNVTGSDNNGLVTFSIVYTDLAGNPGTTGTSTSNGSSVTIDIVNPSLNSVSIASNNTLNTSRAKVGDQITLSFTSPLAIKNVVATIEGKATEATSNPGRTSWTATYIMEEDVDDGILEFVINFDDLAANAGDPVSSTTNASLVRFDKTTPELSDVSIISNNANNNQLAKVGDEIILSFIASEGIRNVAAQIGGRNAALTNSNHAKDWEARYTMQITDMEGILSIQITYQDSTGNQGIAVTDTDDASSITFDRTVPTISNIAIASDNIDPAWATLDNTITLTFLASEEIIPTVTFNGNIPSTLVPDGNSWTATYIVTELDNNGLLVFSAAYTDMAGNSGATATSTSNGSTVTIDVQKPSLNTVSIASNNTLSTSRAKVGDQITLLFTSPLAIKNVTATIAGKETTPTSNAERTSWTAIYVLEDDINDGILPFEINFEDLAANAGDPVSTTTNASFVRFDKTAPELSGVSITSNNTNNNQLAKVGDEVTLSFIASEGIRNVNAQIGGRNATLTSSNENKDWEARYTMQSNDLEGELAILITFRDSTGNLGADVTTTSEPTTKVTFDRTKPMLSSVSIQSNNTENNQIAREGDIITLSFEATEGIRGVTATISERAAIVLPAGVDGKLWTATYTMQSDDLERIIPFAIAFQDSAGNAGNNVVTTTDQSRVVYDRTAPSLTFASIQSNYINSNMARTGSTITVNFTSSEAIDNVVATILGQNALVTFITGNSWRATYSPTGAETEGPVAFDIQFIDLSGNTGQHSTTTDGSAVEYDKTPPTLAPVLIYSDHSRPNRARLGSLITIEFEANETIEFVTVKVNNKNAAVDYSEDEGRWFASYYPSSTDPEAAVTFTINYKDLAGNSGTQVTTTSNGSSVAIDKVKPTFNLVTIYSSNDSPQNATTDDEITLEFTTSEDIETPVVTINGIEATSLTGGPTSWVAKRILSSDENEGLIPFTIEIVDYAGNEAPIRFTTTDGTSVLFDNSLPGISNVTVPAGVYKVGSTIQVFIQADFNNYIGVVTEVNSKPQTLINNQNNTYTIIYTVEEGDNQLFSSASLPVNIVFQDAAGNTNSRDIAIAQGGYITIDTHIPQIQSITSNAEVEGMLKIGDQLIFTLTPESAEVGLIITPTTYNSKPIAWTTSNGGATYTATYTVVEGDATQVLPLQIATITISDAAGNFGVNVDYLEVLKPIYATRPTVAILGTTSKCAYEGQTVPVTFQLTGYKPFTLTYSNGTQNIGPLVIDNYSYGIEVEDGTYSLVSLIDSTGNTNSVATQNAVITNNPLPIVTLDIYPKIYKNTDNAVNLNNPAFINHMGGIFTGEGVTAAGFFFPSFIVIPDQDQSSDVTITYTYTDPNGCTSAASDILTVSKERAIITLFKQTWCNYEDSFTVTGTNPNGITGEFTVTSPNGVSPVGWQDHGNNTLTINPQELIAGKPSIVYTVRYFFTEEGQDYDTQRTFKIDSVGTGIDFGTLDPQYCINAGNVSLSATNRYPEGGTGSFTGPAGAFTIVSNTNSNEAIFEPSKLEPDLYTIEYYYTSPLGCKSDTISKNVTINALPVVSFDLKDNYNIAEDAVQLQGNHASGSFSGNLVANNNLYPSFGISGQQYPITYTYTSPETGCSNSLTKSTLIRKATETIENLVNLYCYSTDLIEISCTIADSTDVVGVFSSNWGAIIPNGNNQALFSVAAVGSGLPPNQEKVDIVLFTYTLGTPGTVYQVSKRVEVDSIGAVSFTELPVGYCEYHTSVPIIGYPVTYTLGGGGTFTYTGTANAFQNTNTNNAIFSPALESPGTVQDITYTFTSNKGCISSITQQVNIWAMPEVEIINLPEFYNIDNEPLELVGDPPGEGGVFSGTGVILNQNIFDPEDDDLGPHSITFTYTDENGCINDTTQTITVVGPDGVINGFAANGWACYDAVPFTIWATVNNGTGGAGQFFGSGVFDNEDGTAIFNPSIAGEGDHIITYLYKYSGDGTTALTLPKTIKVDNLGVVEITGLLDEYCYNNVPTTLTVEPNMGGSWNNEPYIISSKFYPSFADTAGVNPVIYTYTNINSGCYIADTINVTVHPVPHVDFTYEGLCSDLITESLQFWNTTYSTDQVASWLWDFRNDNTSTEENPKFLYTSDGLKLVDLKATTVYGCESSVSKSFTVGLVPRATFTWLNECLTGNPTQFISTNDPSVINTWQWEFEDETMFGDTVNYPFTEIGYHDVKLVIKSTNDCYDTLVKQIYIQPYIKVSELDGSIYYQDFENGKEYWDARPIAEDEYYSWNFGLPEGYFINSAASGENAWHTMIDVDNQKVEKSQVLSPCFDLRSLEKPMLKFNIWSSPNIGRDGAVLQYDLNGSNEWQILGTVGDGINWFNSSTIESQPGDQFFGWSSVKMDDWTSARISLDELKDSSNVRFRIAYATRIYLPNPSPYDGFAFDDFWIGNRKKELLLEYFTNNTTPAYNANNSYIVSFENQNNLDIRAIHYHTSNPVGDPLYSYYPAGPSAREFFYGISSIPYALVNGNQALNLTSTSTNSALIKREILKDPLFDISVSCSDNDGIQINTVARVLESFSGKDLVLYCAIVQKVVEVSNAPSGVTTFYNVLRNFLPDPGGTPISGSMAQGQTFTKSFTWEPPSANALQQSRVIVFVQDIQTSEVFQSGYFDLSALTSVKPDALLSRIVIYPNPATHSLWVDSPVMVEQISIYDLSGKVLNSYNANGMLISVPVDRLRNGAYLIKLRTTHGEIVRKFIKQ